MSSWAVEDDGRELRSVFDLHELELRYSHWRSVIFQVEDVGAGAIRNTTLGPGRWGIEARPGLGEGLALYLEGRAIVENDFEAARESWERLADRLVSLPDMESAVWLRVRIATEAASQGHWDAAHENLDLATVLAAERAPHLETAVWELRSKVEERERSPEHALEAWRRAIELRRRETPSSLELAHDLAAFGAFAGRRGQLDPSAEHLREALELWERLAPGSLGVGLAVKDLGVVAGIRGNLELAKEHFERARSVFERVAPEGPDIAATLNNLANIARRRGELDDALELYQRSADIQRALDPKSIALSRTLNNLGIVSKSTGDLLAAERHYRDALAIKREVAPDSLEYTRTLGNLANLADERGDIDRAQELHRETLPLFEELAPESLTVATNLGLLGKIARMKGELDEAERYQVRALELRRRLAPESLFLASSIAELGSIAMGREDLDEAVRLHEEALTLRRSLAPTGLATAESLFSLGVLELERGGDRLDTAQSYLNRCLEIRSRLAPDSTAVAEAHHALGRVHLGAGRREDAAASFERAVAALERQRSRLGGSQEVRSGFGARHAHIYKDAIALEAAEKRNDEAFSLLERYRTRVFLELLEGRDLVPEDLLPPELAKKRRSLHREHDRLRARLAALAGAGDDDVAIGDVLQRLAALERERQRVFDDFRAASPRFAELEAPETHDAESFRARLDPGTLLLSYATLPESTLLFVMRRNLEGEVPVLNLPIGEAELRSEVERFRDLIRHSVQAPEAVASLHALAATLYQTLLAPAEAWIGPSERLLIVPDGPLHVLPFAALRIGDAGSYLIQDKPLHMADSASVYAKLIDRRGEGEADSVLRKVVAFGNVQSETELLPTIPGAGAEAESIGRIFGGASLVLTGSRATEERAKSIQHARYIHFASHGVLDDHAPLDSHLVLNPSTGEDNGLLQAWEVFEQMRFDAELVTLSACDSGLGKELGGEGLFGLTRAFQFAGARSVVATLWNVSDRSTLPLMVRFYENLESGMTKDAALRSAQLELIEGPVTLPFGTGRAPTSFFGSFFGDLFRGSDSLEEEAVDATHPFYWASFRVTGDWM